MKYFSLAKQKYLISNISKKNMAFSIEKYHFRTGSIFEGLPAAEFKLLKQNMVRQEIKKGKAIFREGHYSKGIYILRKGKVKIFQVNKEGKEQIAFTCSKNVYL